MAEQAVGQAQARVIEGNLVVPPGARFALVASRFNHFIVDRLVEGALDAIARHGGALGRTSIVRVPGAWEMPTIVGRLAHKKSVDAIITLGAVIRGSTPHFDYVAAEVTKGSRPCRSRPGCRSRSACSRPTRSSKRSSGMRTSAAAWWTMPAPIERSCLCQRTLFVKMKVLKDEIPPCERLCRGCSQNIQQKLFHVAMTLNIFEGSLRYDTAQVWSMSDLLQTG